MEYRIKLKAKQDFGMYKQGSICILYNNPFDTKNGVAFFEIDQEIWEFVSADLFSGFVTEEKKPVKIYENDFISGQYHSPALRQYVTVTGKVVFDFGSMSIKIKTCTPSDTSYEIGQMIPIFDFINLQIVEENNLDV